MKVSVIVTVHNAERTIRECLDSVTGQTFADIEIICMDGGSRDATPQILKEYADKDPRIRIISDPNTSYGHKVNEGIRLAGGEYISVLESDDMYRPDMLERLYTVVKQYHPDFVNADYVEFLDVAGRRHYSLVRMYREEDYDCLLESGRHPENMRRILRYWTGLFRRDFLIHENIRMNESPGASFQDMSFRFLTSALAKTSYHVRGAVYLYRTDNPASSVADPGKSVATADEFGFLKKELEKRKIMNPYIWQHFYTWKYNDLYSVMTHFTGKARKELFDRCIRELETDKEKLKENDYGRYSEAVSHLLDWTLEEIEEDIEKKYQRRREAIQRRREFYEKVSDRNLVIFGCGAWGKTVLKWMYLSEERILCFTDNSEQLWGTKLEGHQILAPEDAAEKYPDACYVVANKYHADEIEEQILKLGIPMENILKFL